MLKMSIKKPVKCKLGFGIQSCRFATIGYHPDLDRGGLLRKTGGLGPGQYPVKFIQCYIKDSENKKESWTRKKEVEEFSENLGYRNADVLNQRQEELKNRGPGWFNINPSLFEQQSSNVKENVFFGLQKRFSQKFINKNPPPGSYGINHDPYIRFEAKKKPRLQFTKVPPFEWDNFQDRFKMKKAELGSNLPPNLYRFKSGFQETLSKQVSKRGPYDLFTGPRDNSTIKGYFSLPKPVKQSSWPGPAPPSDLAHLLKRPHKGQFFTAIRCPPIKDNGIPGPGYYNVKPGIEKKKSNKYAFNQSVKHVRKPTLWTIEPGVGRYNATMPKCSINKRQTWQFKSTSKREFYNIITYNSF